MWNRCAFTIADREYLWSDIALAAMWHGEWAALDTRLRQGLACETFSYDDDDPADQEAVDAATTEFRYAEDLITAEETERWLERVGLSLHTWSRFFSRRNLLARYDARLDDILASYPPDDDSVLEHLPAEGICSGRLRELGEALAGLAALAYDESEAASVPASPVDEARVDALLAAYGFVLGAARADARDRLAHFAWLDAVFERASARVATPEAVQAQIDASRLDWLVVDLERLAFPEESMVRETLLCCREDNLTLSQLASRIRRSVDCEQIRLEDSTPELRPMLLSAPPGELLGPIAIDDRFLALVVREKRLPSVDDPDVRRLAQSAVVDAMLRRARLLHVQWTHWV